MVLPCRTRVSWIIVEFIDGCIVRAIVANQFGFKSVFPTRLLIFPEFLFLRHFVAERIAVRF